MVKQTRKPTKSPASDDDWKRALETFAYYRILDDDVFFKGVEKLAEQLRIESTNAYDAAVRMLAGETHRVADHDRSAIILKIEKKGITEQQIALAELELLDFGELPKKSWILVSPDELDELLKGPAENLQKRTYVSVDERKVVRSLRTQATRLKGGAERVQRIIEDYGKRRKAIKPAVSVAWHTLFESTEQWGAEPKEIAERIAALVRHPEMKDHFSEDKHVGLWHVTVKTARNNFRKRKRTKGTVDRKK